MSTFNEYEQQELVDDCIDTLQQLGYSVDSSDNVRVSTLKLITALALKVHHLEDPTA